MPKVTEPWLGWRTKPFRLGRRPPPPQPGPKHRAEPLSQPRRPSQPLDVSCFCYQSLCLLYFLCLGSVSCPSSRLGPCEPGRVPPVGSLSLPWLGCVTQGWQMNP